MRNEMELQVIEVVQEEKTNHQRIMEAYENIAIKLDILLEKKKKAK